MFFRHIWNISILCSPYRLILHCNIRYITAYTRRIECQKNSVTPPITMALITRYIIANSEIQVRQIKQLRLVHVLRSLRIKAGTQPVNSANMHSALELLRISYKGWGRTLLVYLSKSENNLNQNRGSE